MAALICFIVFGHFSVYEIIMFSSTFPPFRKEHNPKVAEVITLPSASSFRMEHTKV